MLNNEQYMELMARYFAGETTPEEVVQLSVWVEADESNKALFREYQKAWQLANDQLLEESIDIDEEWARMETLLPDEEEKKVISISPAMQGVRWATRIAAILLIAIVPLYFLYQYFDQPDMLAVSSENQVMETVLPDGTVVNLNRNSSIQYPEEFDGKFREISFIGEALFSVAHDRTKPFIIATNGIRVKVLGTTFNINTRKPGDETEVVLVEGSVKVYYKDHEKEAVKLLPGEKAMVRESEKTIVVHLNENPNFMAWKTRLMIFRDEPLDKVVETINHVYGANLVLADEELATCRLSATFDRQPLPSVMQVIASTLELEIQSTPEQTILSGAPCNR